VPGFPAWFRTASKDPSKVCNTFWAIIDGWRAIQWKPGLRKNFLNVEIVGINMIARTVRPGV